MKKKKQFLASIKEGEVHARALDVGSTPIKGDPSPELNIVIASHTPQCPQTWVLLANFGDLCRFNLKLHLRRLQFAHEGPLQRMGCPPPPHPTGPWPPAWRRRCSWRPRRPAPRP